MTEKKAIRYISLAAKAGKLITGAEDCEDAVRRRHKNGVLLLASDAGGDASRRGTRLAENHHLHLMRIDYTKTELASAVGRRSPVALALVTDEGLAAAFAAAAANRTEQEERI